MELVHTLERLALSRLFLTFDYLDWHAGLQTADREVLQAALCLCTPILGTIDLDISECVRLYPHRGDRGHRSP